MTEFIGKIRSKIKDVFVQKKYEKVNTTENKTNASSTTYNWSIGSLIASCCSPRINEIEKLDLSYYYMSNLDSSSYEFDIYETN